MEEMRKRMANAEWGEHTPSREDYLNGFSYKDWATDLGMLEKLKIPRTRQKTGKKLAGQIRTAYRKQKEEIHRLLREIFGLVRFIGDQETRCSRQRISPPAFG